MSDDFNHRPPHFVIGSGPTGVACAHALLQRGARVVLLDAGVTLEEPRRKLVSEMSARPPEAWTPREIQALKAGMTGALKGIPQKLTYGSDYPYRETDAHLPTDYDGVAVRPSLAVGGFSTVWGAAVMPYSDADMAGWPIGSGDLAEHYAAVGRLTGMSAVPDDLAGTFPLHSDGAPALALSRQAAAVQARLKKSEAALRAAGIRFGQARLAVKAGDAGCVYCGLCMYGCPYGYIYNSEQTLRELERDEKFTYRSNAIVTRLRERGEEVLIGGYHRQGREPFELSARRVYLATGVLATARIVLESLELYEQPVRLKDSQYYLFPLLTRSGGAVHRESLHALSQLFLEIADPAVTARPVHLQLYSYNDLIGQAIRQPLGPAAGVLGWLARGLERRLLVAQGYLHSDCSSQISLRLKKGEPARLEARAEVNLEARPAVRRVLRKLWRHGRQTGAWPLAPLLQMAEPGRGFHDGGSFPMRQSPAGLETDTLGRLPAWRRVHLVDASILPEIPATQITFSVMANAHRIASQTAGDKLI